MVRDLTKGKPLRLLLGFCAPLLIGNLFQQFYNMVDSIIVGKFIGKDALAAVGSTGSLNFLIIGFVLGMCSGFCLPVAQYFGEGDEARVRGCVANAVYLSAAITVVLTAATMLGTRPLLELMQTPGNIIDDAYAYIVVIFAGIFATVLYNLLAGILRALGDSRTPLYFLILSSVLNVGMDLLFILYFNAGVAGAAYATVIAQLVSGVCCLVYMIKRYPILRMKKENLRPNRHLTGRLLYIGLPMAGQFSITAVGSTIIQSAVNSLGSGVVAAVTAAGKVQIMLCQPMETMGITMATYCGQNYGAGEVGRIREGMRKSLLVVLLYSVIGFFIAAFAGQYIALLFLDARETEILGYVQQFLFVNGLFYPALGILFVIRNSLQGLGFSVPAMAAGLCELVARTVVAFCFVTAFGYNAVCFANPAAWSAAVMLLIPLYFWGMRRLRRDKAVYDRLKEDIDERQS